jgi:hypothetical protein
MAQLLQPHEHEPLPFFLPLTMLIMISATMPARASEITIVPMFSARKVSVV